MLPTAFLLKMKTLLKDDFPAFLTSYAQERSFGLRINPLKLSPTDFQKRSPFALTRIPWCNTGFYYPENERPGKHPFHEQGLYYIQEPSAMAVVECLGVEPGDFVLDLCAAPGGKSTHIAGKLQGKGFLVANEINAARAKVLSQNIERLGVINAIVTNETPERLSKHFGAIFDRILVDAPCSGEGMFRKDAEAINEWSPENVGLCAKRQEEILRQAKTLLKPGGRLVYSTCTFSPEENEGTISQFIAENPEFELIAGISYPGFACGNPSWADGNPELSKTLRLWPHQIKGEGHFIAVLEKRAGDVQPLKPGKAKALDPKLLKIFADFASSIMVEVPKSNLVVLGEQLYQVPFLLDLTGLKVERMGLHLGSFKTNRFEPNHAWALALSPNQVKQTVELNDSEVLAYLRGESINVNGPKGWVLVCYQGYSIGWGKISNGELKNHYPKGLRWT